jgi:hypothetical protein
MLEQTKNIELLAFILRLKKLYNCGYISFKEYWRLHVKHKTISLYKLEKLTSMLLEQGILIKGRKGYSMLNFNKACKALFGISLLIPKKSGTFKQLKEEILEALIVNQFKRTKHAVGKQLGIMGKRVRKGIVDMIPEYLESKVVNAYFSCRSIAKAVQCCHHTVNRIINSLIQRGLLKIRREVFDITKHQRKHEYFYAQRWFIDLRLESIDSFKK